MVIWAPLALLSLLAAVQAAVWCLAELGVAYTADHAVQTTRVQGGTAATGAADARQVLAAADGGLARGPHITAQRDATTATVHVTATALPVVPFLHLPLSATATAPVEALTP